VPGLYREMNKQFPGPGMSCFLQVMHPPGLLQPERKWALFSNSEHDQQHQTEILFIMATSNRSLSRSSTAPVDVNTSFVKVSQVSAPPTERDKNLSIVSIRPYRSVPEPERRVQPNFEI
jgi:hypothetical protein